MKTKQAAIEMSMSTIVILVLAMTMLILGLVLVKSIFTGAKYNVDQINDKVKDEVNKLFVEDKEIVVYLPNQKVEIKQKDNWGVVWAVKNLETGAQENTKLNYNVVVSSETIKENCGISAKDAESWIKEGKSESNIPLPPGKAVYPIIRISVPKTAPLCIIRYRIDAKLNGKDYASEFFDLEVK